MLNLSYSIADQNFAHGKSLGILNVSLNLLRHLARRPELCGLTVFSNRTLREQVEAHPKLDIKEHDKAIAGRLSRILWDQRGVYRAAAVAGREWLVLAKGFASFMRPCPVQLAAIVYDAMTDFYMRNYPRAVSRFENWYFEKSLAATLRQAEVIFTISHFTTSEILRLAREHGLPAPNVITMGIGFSPNDPLITHLSPAPQERRGLLVLSSKWPHKRTYLAIDYLQKWQDESHFDETVHWAGSLPEGVRLTGRLNWVFHPRPPDELYAGLLASSRAVIFFSEYEGFGMPPVEAALAGACPVFSDIPATREVMQDAGCKFANEDFASFARAMNEALSASADTISGWAQALVRRHNWQSVCDRVVAGLTDSTPAHKR